MLGKRLHRLIGGALIAAGFTSAGCQPQNQFVPPPPSEVTVARPVERKIADSIEFVGTTQATASVDLRAKVSGYLERIQFEDGADVNQGDPLFLIEQAPFKIALITALLAALPTSRSPPISACTTTGPDDIKIMSDWSPYLSSAPLSLAIHTPVAIEPTDE